MSIKMLVNPFETSTVQKHELGLIVDDPRGGNGEITITDLLPQEGSGTSIGGPTQQTIGVRRFSPDALFKYVRNGETNPFAGGEAVALLLSTTETTVTDEPAVVTRTVDTTRVLEGITISAIPAAGFGFIQIRGKVPGVPDTNTNGFTSPILRGGVKVSATTVQAADFVRPGTTNPGELIEFTLATVGSNLAAADILHMLGRKVQCIRDSRDEDPSTNTDVRAEVYIY